MKDLLKLDDKDLLTNERVRTACDGLGVDIGDYSHVSVADLAFEIRDACDPEEWRDALAVCTTFAPEFAMPGHWISAAVLAWEAKK